MVTNMVACAQLGVISLTATAPATAEFTRMVEMNVHKGDEIEVTGWRLEFEGVQTIFAHEVKHGNETYVFRAKDGTPAWMY